MCFALPDQDLKFGRVNEAVASNHGILAEEHRGRCTWATGYYRRQMEKEALQLAAQEQPAVAVL